MHLDSGLPLKTKVHDKLTVICLGCVISIDHDAHLEHFTRNSVTQIVFMY